VPMRATDRAKADERALLAQARAGDELAFSELVGVYGGELRSHCYRMLGSVHDAEDALQDALLRAWRGLPGFGGRSSVRSWLYAIATNTALDITRRRSRRELPVSFGPAARPGAEFSAALPDALWLEPFPDRWLSASPAVSPEARYDQRESIELAFVVALQRLPALQRAVLILRDVLGFTASEAAQILGVSEESVTSALKRARAAMRSGLPDRCQPPPAPESASEKQLIDRLIHAYETGDVAAIIALFTDDAWLAMPPAPLEYQGRDRIAEFLKAIAFRDGLTYQLVPVRANGQLAFGAYVSAGRPEAAQANGLLVLSLSGGRITAMTRFPGVLLPRFGLPPS
jgi:RNA polymerase sigma-70 factor (TIGR02960 family)